MQRPFRATANPEMGPDVGPEADGAGGWAERVKINNKICGSWYRVEI
jgi:hypothetical protein